MDPEQHTTSDLLAAGTLRQEIQRIAAMAAALHAARASGTQGKEAAQ